METTVYGPLRGTTGEKTVDVPFDGGTVADALARFVDEYPRTKAHLVSEAEREDDDIRVRPSVRVLLDGDRVDLDAECPPDASLQLIPAAQGG